MPRHGPSRASLADAFDAIPHADRDAATRLMTGCDVNQAWAGFTCIVEAMYAGAGLASGDLHCRSGQVKLQRPTAALTPDGDTANTALRFHLRRWRRLRELVRLWPLFPSCPSGPAANVWKAVLQAEPRGSCFGMALALVRSGCDMQSCCALAKALYEEASVTAREFRRDRWHRWCCEQESRGRLFKWVRSPAATPVAINETVRIATPEAQLQEAHAWWTRLWDPLVAEPPDTERFGSCLADLPQFPPMPPLCGDRVAAVLHSTPSAKAAGFDGWRYEELKEWPRQLVDLLTLFYGVVERVGRWPACLSTALVALLPKGMSGSADDSPHYALEHHLSHMGQEQG